MVNRDQLLRFGENRPSGDWDYFAPLLRQEAGILAFLDMANGLLTDPKISLHKYIAACVAIPEAYIHGPDSPVQPFRDALLEHPIAQTLTEGVNAPGLSRRWITLDTVRKMGILRAIPRLREIFTQRRDTDPLFISSLHQEINGLEQEEEGAVYYEQREDQILQSTNFLTRWSLLANGRFPSADTPLPHYIEILAEDRNALVRTEARFVRDDWQLRRALRTAADDATKR